ncbi:hypothetical protein PQX77_016535 [Marasmius sp. AFHP31]|nr:hypothetical protein PQX77_016535 [Marasmius sp. AFHP31]
MSQAPEKSEESSHCGSSQSANAGNTSESGRDVEEVAMSSKEHTGPGPTGGEDVFPDGGIRAWLCVLGSFSLSAVCYGMLNTFGVFQEHYRVDTLKDRPIQDISWIGSLQLSLILLTGCVSGPLFDAGYFKHLIGTGGVLYVFTLFMASISTKYYQFILAQGVGVGIAAGLLFTPGVSVLAHHFQRYRNIVFGIFAGGASVSGAVLPIVVQKLLRAVGLPWTMRIRE